MLHVQRQFNFNILKKQLKTTTMQKRIKPLKNFEVVLIYGLLKDLLLEQIENENAVTTILEMAKATPYPIASIVKLLKGIRKPEELLPKITTQNGNEYIIISYAPDQGIALIQDIEENLCTIEIDQILEEIISVEEKKQYSIEDFVKSESKQGKIEKSNDAFLKSVNQNTEKIFKKDTKSEKIRKKLTASDIAGINDILLTEEIKKEDVEAAAIRGKKLKSSPNDEFPCS